MRLPFFIALRYLVARKSKSVINVISWISLIGLSVSSMALIVVLSVYNGIGKLTQSMFNSFDPELVVEPAEGKSFRSGDIDMEQLRQIPRVAVVSEIVEENAWVTHKQNQAIVELRGVDGNYQKITGIDTLLYDGVYVLESEGYNRWGEEETLNYVVMGKLLYDQLGLKSLAAEAMAVHIPKRGEGIGYTMDEAFNTGYAYLAGTYYIQEDIDGKYVVASIGFVRSLLDYDDDECTSLAIGLSPKANAAKVKEAVRNIAGERFLVKDRYEQQPLYYKIYRTERWGIILILSLIVLISTLNLMASLALLMIDKKRDVATLRSMGMTKKQVKRMFFEEGVMISMIGALSGLVFGFILCWLQQTFGLIKMGTGFVVSAFPVAMKATDFLLTFVLVTVLSSLAVWVTTRRSRF